MKYFLSILHRPMAFIFLLLFVGGCLGLLYSIETKDHDAAVDPIIEQQISTANKNEEFSKDVSADDALLSEQPITGPDIIEVYEPEFGNAGTEDAEFVVLSEVIDDPSLCTEFEKYDTLRQVCYFTCATENQCDQTEQMVNDALSDIDGVYDKFAGSYTELYSPQETRKTLATYIVEEGEWLERKTGNALEKYEDIWAIFATITPDELSDKYISKYTVYENKESETAAFVRLIADEDRKWELAVNIEAIEELTRDENIFLLTHEFAHILTLNEDQIDPQVEESACLGFYTDEGCATESSYIGLFFKEFWSQADVLALQDAQDDSQSTLFKQSPEKFLNDYASTNPGEDIAESFVAFIFKSKPLPSNAEVLSIAQQKMNFFYKFPELIKIRADIRGELNVERTFEKR